MFNIKGLFASFMFALSLIDTTAKCYPSFSVTILLNINDALWIRLPLHCHFA